MIDAICDIISIHCTFTASEIRDAYDACSSFDLLIAAIEHCRATGQTNLARTAKKMAETWVFWMEKKP